MLTFESLVSHFLYSHGQSLIEQHILDTYSGKQLSQAATDV
jgi:hypothetical protein